MSERTIRKQNAEILAQSLVRVQKVEGAVAKEKEALELAHQVLLEEPKTVIPCRFLHEFVPFNAVTERSHCSECRGAAIGWNEQWTHCPLCGSRIVQAEREANPHDRNIRERVDFALKEKCINA